MSDACSVITRVKEKVDACLEDEQSFVMKYKRISICLLQGLKR